MSELQARAKPFISALLNDEWPVLDAAAQSTIAAWAAMFAMVVEFADPKTATIPQEHRTSLMKTGRAPQDWSVWIGRHDAGRFHPAYFNHFGTSRLGFTHGFLQLSRFQSTGFTVGRLFIQTLMLTPPQLMVDHDGFAAGYGLRTILPFKGTISNRPTVVHDLTTRHIVSCDAARALGIRTMSTPLPIAES